MEQNAIKILLANDNKPLREGMISAFKTIALHIQIIEEARDFSEILKKLPNTQCDILMSDDKMEGENILTYLPLILDQYPGLKIIVNSGQTSETPDIKKMMEWSKGWLSF